MLVIPSATLASTKRLGVVGGGSEYPTTFAPALSSHRDSQLPLNPVCPVNRTFLFRQKSAFITRSSTVLFQWTRVSPADSCRAGCPSAAKNLCVDTRRDGLQRPSARVVLAPMWC